VLLLAAVLLPLAAGCAEDADAPTATRSPGKRVEERQVDAGDVTLHVRAVGDPDAARVLIAVHGGPGLSLEAMAAYEELVAPGRRVVLYDQRGSGRSSDPAGGAFTLEHHVADLEAVRAWAGVDGVAILGQSWGGAVAAAYAAQHPERVDALVLVGAIPLDRAEFLAGQGRFRQRVQELQQVGAVPDPLPRAEGSCLEALLAVMPAYVADSDTSVDLPGVTCDAAASRRSYEAFVDSTSVDDLAKRLGAFDGRALVVAGASDPFGSPWLRRNVAILEAADVQRLVVDDAGHLVATEQPERLLAAVDSFLVAAR
jgi:pimeloyl-ACP methyl ester carboxylesterase